MCKGCYFRYLWLFKQTQWVVLDCPGVGTELGTWLPYWNFILFCIAVDVHVKSLSCLVYLTKQVCKHCTICRSRCFLRPSCPDQNGSPSAPSTRPADLPSVLQLFHLLLQPLWELPLWRVQPIQLRWWWRLRPGRLRPPPTQRRRRPQPVCAAGRGEQPRCLPVYREHCPGLRLSQYDVGRHLLSRV